MSQLVVPVGPRDHVAGPQDAPVTLVEYGDFECPHCGRAHPLVQQVRQTLANELRFAYRHFPLSRVHPHAEHAAEISELAAEHGQFWEMHDLLFEHQDALEDADLIEYAATLAINGRKALAALEEERDAPRVREDFAGGVRSGVNGTPTFFINGVRYDGPWDQLLETLTAVTQG